jgi:hypothetical protein
MPKTAKVAPPNSVVLVTGRDDGGGIPLTMATSVVAATESCIAVGCLSEADGQSQLVLGPWREIAEGDEPAFVGLLKTPDRKVEVRSVEGETLLAIQVPTEETVVRIWVNHALEPDRILIGVGD